MPVHNVFVWDAFWELSSDRPAGMGPGPIPFTSIDRYAARYGITDIDDFERFRGLIRAMDRAYLSHGKKGGDGSRIIDPNDGKSLKAALRGLAAKKAEQA